MNISIIVHFQKSSCNYDVHRLQYNAQGITENWDDFWTNLAVNGAANMVGLTFDAIPILRTLGSNTGKNLLRGGKKLIKQGINSFADKMKNMYYNDDEDDEKYHY